MKDYPLTTLSIMWSYLLLMIVAACQHYGTTIPGHSADPIIIAGVISAILPCIVMVVQVISFVVADEDDSGIIVLPLSILALLGNVVSILVILT